MLIKKIFTFVFLVKIPVGNAIDFKVIDDTWMNWLESPPTESTNLAASLATRADKLVADNSFLRFLIVQYLLNS